MALSAQVSSDGRTCTIKVSGRFDFNLHREWRTAYEAITPNETSVVIDLRETEYIDSSALGMLLLLRDHMGKGQAEVNIIGCNADIRKVLTIANFHHLFKMS